MNSDGSQPKNLTKSASRDYEPSWSPDGTQIVFSTYRFSGNRDLALMDADGGNVRQLTSSAAWDGAPVFLNNANVAFATNRDGIDPGNCQICDYDIYKVNIAELAVSPIRIHTGTQINPAVSPDGSLIAVEASHLGVWEIFTMSFDGFNFTQITEGWSAELKPSWSPDGEWLLFLTDADEKSYISIINYESRNQYLLISYPYSDNPDWRP